MDLWDFTPRRARSVRVQITEHLRGLILAGGIPAGTRLPTTRELAVRWRSNPATVHEALAALVREGLLERRPRLGTFSLGARPRLRRIAAYLADHEGEGQVVGFERAVLAAFGAACRRRQIAVEQLSDPRPARGQSVPWPELAAAAAERRVQAVVAARVHDRTAAWLDRLPVVTAFVSSLGWRNCVVLDPHQFVRESLRDLHRRGCRRPALINPVFARHPDPLAGGRRVVAQNEEFAAVAAGLGMELRPEWVVGPGRGLADREYPEFGHRALRRLWAGPERPDGLVVVTDTVGQGVLYGIAEAGIRIPGQLQLVLQRNAEVPFYCPVPATIAVMHAARVAEALLDLVLRQFAGAEVSPVVIGSEFIAVPGVGLAAKPQRRKAS